MNLKHRRDSRAELFYCCFLFESLEEMKEITTQVQ